MEKVKNLIFIGLAVILLLPGLFFPLSNDHYIFFRGGEVIANGGTLYQDFIDIKTPLIYYIFAFINVILGRSEIAIRFFDFIYQSATVILLYYVVLRALKSRIASALASAFYSITYISLHFTQTFHTEALAGLPFLVIAWNCIDDENVTYSAMISGVMAGLLFSLKLTFLVYFAALILFYLIPKRQHRPKSILIATAAFLLTFCINLLPFLHPQVRTGFVDIMHFLGFYSSLLPFDSDFIRTLFKSFSSTIALIITIPSIIVVSFGFGALKETDNSYKKSMILLSSIIMIALIISIIAEKRLGGYTFSRLLAPLSLVFAAGILSLYRSSKDAFLQKSFANKILLSVAIALMLFFSPIIKYTAILRIPYYYFTDRTKYQLIFENENNSNILRNQQIKIAEIINSKLRPRDKVIVLSVGGNLVNYFLETKNISRFSQSCFVLSNGTTPRWRQLFIAELRTSTWIVVQTNDRHPIINGHNRTSWESLKHDTQFYNIVEKSYELYKIHGNFYIFRNIKD